MKAAVSGNRLSQIHLKLFVGFFEHGRVGSGQARSGQLGMATQFIKSRLAGLDLVPGLRRAILLSRSGETFPAASVVGASFFAFYLVNLTEEGD